MEKLRLTELEVRLVKFPVGSVYVTVLDEVNGCHYAIISIIEGTVEFVEYGEKYPGEGREIYFIKKSTFLKATIYGPVSLIIIRFSKRFAHDNLYNVHADTLARLFRTDFSKSVADTDNFKVIKRLLYLIYKHHNNAKSPNSLVICQLAFNLLLSCIAELQAISLPLSQRVANYKVTTSMKFLSLVENSAEEQHGVKFYAATLCMTQGNLTRIVKSITGKAPKIIIEETLVQKAKAMLDNDLLTIYQIAEQLGFKSSSAFINFFKFHTGRTPNEYRNRKAR